MSRDGTPIALERDPSDPKRKHVNPILKLALELGPLLVFFFGNAKGAWLAEQFPILAALGGPIFVGTALFMTAVAIAFTISWIITRTIPIMPLLSGAIVLVFGALTLWLHDDTFIKVKPTIINSMFGAILLGGLFFGKSFLGYVFDSAFRLDAEGWRKLTFRWGLFFFFMAGVNEVMWRNFSTDIWIAFKVWGNMPMSILFMMAQLPMMKRHALPDEDEVAPAEA
ncbi:septation protein A [Pseudohoeflea coraliihabitans]|uniref:Inner membrane-spanning protein YciB n=1 Tax=Pseudohoeflea coraliihabitans TaxID=2860393 RepID=A0ABS6WL86_9HYPH|nr:septation protein A [Pseudohoeflea sp. DP4N28-3]MBW3096727.1 septation protein A [Pseudohoeflea sp. DP4N28-3]